MTAASTEKRPMARLFVALELPEDVRDEIVAWQGAEAHDPALRPVRAEALHFTLVFLGGRPEQEIEAIAAALPRGLKAPRIRLLAEPVGVPRGKHPRLYALEAVSEDLSRLQARVASSLREGGFYEPEDRPLWPHLTVARVRSGRGARRPAAVQRPPGPLPQGFEHTFVSVRMQLYRSHLRQPGAEYVSLASLELNPDS